MSVVVIIQHFALLGTTWVEVDSPVKEIETLHVAVGGNVVWVVTKDYKVNQYTPTIFVPRVML